MLNSPDLKLKYNDENSTAASSRDPSMFLVSPRNTDSLFNKMKTELIKKASKADTSNPGRKNFSGERLFKQAEELEKKKAKLRSQVRNDYTFSPVLSENTKK